MVAEAEIKSPADNVLGIITMTAMCEEDLIMTHRVATTTETRGGHYNAYIIQILLAAMDTPTILAVTTQDVAILVTVMLAVLLVVVTVRVPGLAISSKTNTTVTISRLCLTYRETPEGR